jgi:CheY-like chemotaxis protein
MPARILVVEASPEVRTLIADVLTTDGHEVKGVAHGGAALVLIEQRPAFDLVLGDLTVPAIEGAHLYWEIQSRWPHLVERLICVTDGESAGVSDHPILRDAAVPILVKPFLPQVLRDLVKRRLVELGAPPSPDPPQPPAASAHAR